MNEKNRLPNLCSWCKWSNPENNNCIEPSNDDRNYDLKECIDFTVCPTVTFIELIWWPFTWATSEIDRLNLKSTLTHNNK